MRNNPIPCIECGKAGICTYSGLVCEYIYDWELAATNCDGYDT